MLAVNHFAPKRIFILDLRLSIHFCSSVFAVVVSHLEALRTRLSEDLIFR